MELSQIIALWGLVYICMLELTLSPPNKLSAAKFLFFFNFQTASTSLKVGENVVRVSNNLDQDEMASYSPSHPDQSCLHMAL